MILYIFMPPEGDDGKNELWDVIKHYPPPPHQSHLLTALTLSCIYFTLKTELSFIGAGMCFAGEYLSVTVCLVLMCVGRLHPSVRARISPTCYTFELKFNISSND